MSSIVPFDDMRKLLINSHVIDPALIAWPNEDFIQPEPPAIWLSVQATSDVLDPLDIGAGVWREEGSFYIHVMVPAGWGTDDARVMAKNIANIFRSLGPRTVTYRGGSIGNAVIADTEGAWWLITVSQDYIYDDITVVA